MFTGLIAELGKVVSLVRREPGARLTLTSPALSPDAEMGDSIAINGVCLTVVGNEKQALSFDLSDETLRSSNLGALKPGSAVNLEPSLRLNAKLGGHFVTGHIDTVGRIRSRSAAGNMLKFVITAGTKYADLLVDKGSVAVDGISLTVVEVFPDGFSLVIIPHTAKVTTLGTKDAGDSVNLEFDILGKYVARYLGKTRDAGFMKILSEEGFA